MPRVRRGYGRGETETVGKRRAGAHCVPGGMPAGAFRPAVFRRPCRRNVRPRESYTGLVSYGGVPGCGELLSGDPPIDRIWTHLIGK